MSKRVKNVVPVAFNLIDFPVEILQTIAQKGSTRRRLSRTSKSMKDRLGSAPESRRVEDLREGMLDYYDQAKNEIKANEVDQYHVFLEIKSTVTDNDWLDVEINFPKNLLTRKDFQGTIVERKYELTLLPIDILPTVVRNIVSSIFHYYYEENDLYKPFYKFILNINPVGSASFIRFQWSSLQSFVENNPYYILVDALTKKYESLSYFYDLPTFLGNYASTYTETQYETYFKLYKNKFTLNAITEETEFDSKVVTSVNVNASLNVFGSSYPLKCKGTVYTTEKETVFLLPFHLYDEIQLFSQSIEQCKVFTILLLEFIQFTLPKALQYLPDNAHSKIIIYISLKDLEFNLPFYFTIDKGSLYSQYMYNDAFDLLLNWMKQFPIILAKEQIKYIRVD